MMEGDTLDVIDIVISVGVILLGLVGLAALGFYVWSQFAVI